MLNFCVLFMAWLGGVDGRSRSVRTARLRWRSGLAGINYCCEDMEIATAGSDAEIATVLAAALAGAEVMAGTRSSSLDLTA